MDTRTNHKQDRLRVPNWLLLAIGALLTIATHERFGIQILAWIVYVPFWIYLRRTRGWGTLAAFVGVLFVGWTLATLKIITEPHPWYFSLIYALPITLLHALGHSTVRWAGKSRNWWLVTAAAMTVAEWLLGALTPFGTWGTLAYARLDDLALLQTGSLFGIIGISLILLVVNGFVAWLLADRPAKKAVRRAATSIGGVLIAVYAFGWLRVSLYEGRSKETLTVATVDHDITGFTFHSSPSYAKPVKTANSGSPRSKQKNRTRPAFSIKACMNRPSNHWTGSTQSV